MREHVRIGNNKRDRNRASRPETKNKSLRSLDILPVHLILPPTTKEETKLALVHFMEREETKACRHC